VLRRPAIYVAAIVVGAVAFAVGLPWWAAAVVAVAALLVGAVVAAWLFAVGARPPGAHEPASPAIADAPSVFRLEGEYWTIAYHGATIRLVDSKGLGHVHRLLQTPGVEVHVLDLVVVSGSARPTVTDREGMHVEGSSAQPMVDRETRSSIKLRIEDLQDQIEEAEANADPERGARAREELDQLLEEVSKVIRPDGSSRAHTDDTEKARLNVRRAIHSAIEKIREQDPSLGHHLDHDIRTGTYCSYQPDPATAPDWVL
jgi:hypothetical protein